jgi:hypothetical protein
MTINYYSVLERVQSAASMKELDKIAIEYFSNVEDKEEEYNRLVDLAIVRREGELHRAYLLQEAAESPNEQAIPFFLLRKKSKVEAEDNEPTLLNHINPLHIKCDCPGRHGVPCIHRATFDSILPKDYRTCQTCGVDHTYDFRLAKEVHDKLGESI